MQLGHLLDPEESQTRAIRILCFFAWPIFSSSLFIHTPPQQYSIKKLAFPRHLYAFIENNGTQCMRLTQNNALNSKHSLCSILHKCLRIATKPAWHIAELGRFSNFNAAKKIVDPCMVLLRMDQQRVSSILFCMNNCENLAYLFRN